MSTVRYLRHYIAAVTAAAPDQIYAYLSEDFQEDLDLTAETDFYCDEYVVRRVDVDTSVPYFEFPPDEPAQLLVEEVYPDYYAQAPPDNDVSVPPSLELPEEPEDESFGFEVAPQAPDFAQDQIYPELGNDALGDEDEFGEGFSDTPLAPDVDTSIIAPELSNDQLADEDEFAEGFSDVPLSANAPFVQPTSNAILWIIGPKGIKTKIAFYSGTEPERET